MEPCARGQLLILAPWEHHNEKLTISRKTGKNLFFSPFLRNFATKPASIMDVAFISDKYFKGN